MSNILQPSISAYGQVEIESSTAGMTGLKNLAPETPAQIIRWRPPAEFAHDVPADYALEMAAFADSGGNQRLAPLHGSNQLIIQGFEGGLAVLKNHKHLSGEQIYSYRAYWLAFQWLRARGANLRSFSSTADLVVKRSGRDAVGRGHILPEDLGVNASGQGHPWSVDRLLMDGHEAACAAGIAHPDGPAAIAYGLMEAALLNPLHLPADEVLPMLRLALYAPPDEPAPSTEVQEEVVARLCQAWEEHQDDPQPVFDAWCWGPHSNLPKSLANRRTTAFGKLPQAAVQRVLLDLGWEGYGAISNCLRTALRWLEKCLADDLTPSARELFEQIYLPQEAFGNLPLVLLMDRGSIIQPLVLPLWETPGDPTLIGALHRELTYYQQMVETRRAADRESKRFIAGRTNRHKNPAVDELEPTEPDTSTAAATAVLKNLASQIATREGVRCPECDGELGFEVDDNVMAPDEPLECTGACPHHLEQVRHIEIPWEVAIEAISTLIPPNETATAEKANRRRPR